MYDTCYRRYRGALVKSFAPETVCSLGLFNFVVNLPALLDMPFWKMETVVFY